MKECKMTQEFVAETLGVSRQAVSKWESGNSDPRTTNLMALAKIFGVRAEDLLRDKIEFPFGKDHYDGRKNDHSALQYGTS